MKEHGPMYSSDSESLLSLDQSQEKLLNSSPTSKYNKKLKTYVHIAAIVFYTIIAVSLYVWSTSIDRGKKACENAAVYCKKHRDILA